MTRPDGIWRLDPVHSEVGFTVRHAGISKVRGKFTEVQATVTNDEQTSRVNVNIQADSFTTGNADRDAHVKSPDFLDVEEYPTLTFSGELPFGSDELSGLLSIHGETQQVKLDVELSEEVTDPFGNLRRGVEGRGKINRKDFGLTWNAALEAGGLLVGETVTLELDLSFVKDGSAAA